MQEGRVVLINKPVNKRAKLLLGAKIWVGLVKADLQWVALEEMRRNAGLHNYAE